ncbi:MAG: HAD-IA family hydrolase, partial [Thermoplasmatota archaeon]
MDVQAVAFDLDGTLAETGVRFTPFRERLDCDERDVLRYIDGLDEIERQRCRRILDDYENCILEDCTLTPGFHDLLTFFDERGIKTGIVTRASGRHARQVIEKLDIPIPAIIGREDAPPKPSGAPLLLLARRLDVPPQEMLFVGDFRWDLLAGQNAGVTTVLLLNEHNHNA